MSTKADGIITITWVGGTQHIDLIGPNGEIVKSTDGTDKITFDLTTFPVLPVGKYSLSFTDYTTTITDFTIIHPIITNAVAGLTMTVTWSGGTTEKVVLTDGIINLSPSSLTAGTATFNLSTISEGDYYLTFTSYTNVSTKFYIRDPVVSDITVSSRIVSNLPLMINWVGDSPLNIWFLDNSASTVASNGYAKVITSYLGASTNVPILLELLSLSLTDLQNSISIPCIIQIGENELNSIGPIYFLNGIKLKHFISEEITIKWSGGYQEQISLFGPNGFEYSLSQTSTGSLSFDLTGLDTGSYYLSFDGPSEFGNNISETFNVISPIITHHVNSSLINVAWSGGTTETIKLIGTTLTSIPSTSSGTFNLIDLPIGNYSLMFTSYTNSNTDFTIIHPTIMNSVAGKTMTVTWSDTNEYIILMSSTSLLIEWVYPTISSEGFATFDLTNVIAGEYDLSFTSYTNISNHVTITNPIVDINISSRLIGENRITWTGDQQQIAYVKNATSTITATYNEDISAQLTNMTGPCFIQIGKNTVDSIGPFYFIHNVTKSVVDNEMTVTWTGGPETLDLIGSTVLTSGSATFDLKTVQPGSYYLSFGPGNISETFNIIHPIITNAVAGSLMTVTWSGTTENVVLKVGINEFTPIENIVGSATFNLTNVNASEYDLLFTSYTNVSTHGYITDLPLSINISSRIGIPVVTWGGLPFNVYISHDPTTYYMVNSITLPTITGPCIIQIGENPVNSIGPFYFISNIIVTNPVAGSEMTVTWTGGPETIMLTDGTNEWSTTTAEYGKVTFDLEDVKEGNYSLLFKNIYIDTNLTNCTTFSLMDPTDPINIQLNWPGDTMILNGTQISDQFIDFTTVNIDQYLYCTKSWTSSYDFNITGSHVSDITISSRISNEYILTWIGDSPLDVLVNPHDILIDRVMNRCTLPNLVGPCTIQIGDVITDEFYFIRDIQFQNAISGSEMTVTWTGGKETVTITDGINEWSSKTSAKGVATFDLSDASSGIYKLRFKSILNDVTTQSFFIMDPIISDITISSRVETSVLTWHGDGPLNVHVSYQNTTYVIPHVMNTCIIDTALISGPCTIQIGNNKNNSIIPFYFIHNVELDTTITGNNMTVTWTGGPETVVFTDGIITLQPVSTTDRSATFNLMNSKSGEYSLVFKNAFIYKGFTNSATFYGSSSDRCEIQLNWAGDMVSDSSDVIDLTTMTNDYYLYCTNLFTSNYIVILTDPIISDINISSRIISENRITWTGDPHQIAYVKNDTSTITATYDEDISEQLTNMTGPCFIQIGMSEMNSTTPFYFISNIEIDTTISGREMTVTWIGGPEIISLEDMSFIAYNNIATFDLEHVKAGNYAISFKNFYNVYTKNTNYIDFSISTTDLCTLQVTLPGDIMLLKNGLHVDIYTNPVTIDLRTMSIDPTLYLYYTNSFTSNYEINVTDPIISDIYINRIIGENRVTWTGDPYQFAYVKNATNTITAFYNEDISAQLATMTGPCTIQVGNNSVNSTVPFCFIHNLKYPLTTYNQHTMVTWEGGLETISLMSGSTVIKVYQSQSSPAYIALDNLGTYYLSFKNAFIYSNFTNYSTFTLDLSAPSMNLKVTWPGDILLTNGIITVPYVQPTPPYSLQLIGEYWLYCTTSFISNSAPFIVNPPIIMSISPSTIIQGETFEITFSSILPDIVHVEIFDTVSKITYPAAFSGVNKGFIQGNILNNGVSVASMCGNYNHTMIITLPASTYNVNVYDMSFNLLLSSPLTIRPSYYALSTTEMFEGDPFTLTYTNHPAIPTYFSFQNEVDSYLCIGNFELTNNNYFIWGHRLIPGSNQNSITVTTRHNSSDGPNGIKIPHGTYLFSIQNGIGQFLFSKSITIHPQTYSLSTHEMLEGQPFTLNCIPETIKNSYVLIGNDLGLPNSYLAMGLQENENDQLALWGIPLNTPTTITTLTKDSTIPPDTYKFRVMNSTYVLVYSSHITVT